MSYNFEYYADEMEELLPMVSIVFGIYLAVMVIGLLVKAVLYVIRSLSLHTITKRRGIQNAWLSWVPVGQEWVIGSLSDQYKYLTQGKNQNRRKILLWLKLGALALGLISTGVGIFGVIGKLELLSGYGNAQASAELLAPVMGGTIMSVLSTVVGIAAYVFRQMSMYDLYKSCDPKNAVVFLVFGILFGVTEPFFLLYLRNKDGGMPPRKQEYENPVSDFDL